MALSNTTADALATSICSALGIVDAPSQTKMRDTWRLVYAALKTDIVIQIAQNSIVTAGSAATQTGPASTQNKNPL